MKQPVRIVSFIAPEPEVKPPIPIGMDFLLPFSGGMKPARQLIKRAPHRTVGAIHAPWFQPDPIHHESDLEAAVVRVLLLAPSLTRIQHQPARIPYDDGSQQRHHVPDYLVELGDRQLIVEVKPERFVEQHRTKFDACADILEARGVDYFVCTDGQVDKARGERAGEMLQLARMTADPGELADLLSWLTQQGRACVRSAEARGHSMPMLMHAVGRRLVATDPALRLAPDDWLLAKDSADELSSFEQWLGCSAWRRERLHRLPSPPTRNHRDRSTGF